MSDLIIASILNRIGVSSVSAFSSSIFFKIEQNICIGLAIFSKLLENISAVSIKVFEFNGFVLESVQSHSVRFARTDGENSF